MRSVDANKFAADTEGGGEGRGDHHICGGGRCFKGDGGCGGGDCQIYGGMMFFIGDNVSCDIRASCWYHNLIVRFAFLLFNGHGGLQGFVEY